MISYLEKLLMLRPHIQIIELQEVKGQTLETKARNLLIKTRFEELKQNNSIINAINLIANEFFISYSRAVKIIYDYK